MAYQGQPLSQHIHKKLYSRQLHFKKEVRKKKKIGKEKGRKGGTDGGRKEEREEDRQMINQERKTVLRTRKYFSQLKEVFFKRNTKWRQ